MTSKGKNTGDIDLGVLIVLLLSQMVLRKSKKRIKQRTEKEKRKEPSTMFYPCQTYSWISFYILLNLWFISSDSCIERVSLQTVIGTLNSAKDLLLKGFSEINRFLFIRVFLIQRRHAFLCKPIATANVRTRDITKPFDSAGRLLGADWSQ